MFRNSRIVSLTALSLFLVGCSGTEFGDSKVRFRLETAPIQLSGEQVSLDKGQVDCGVNNELWDLVPQGSEDRWIGRLTQKGRDLHFSDDIQVGDPENRRPYAQINGTFNVVFLRMDTVRDENPTSKLAEVRLGIKMDNECLASPPPQLMGVKHGRFTEEASPRLRFHLTDNWYYDSIVH